MNRKIIIGLSLIALMALMPLSTSALIPTTTHVEPDQATTIKLGGLVPLTGKLAAGGVERDAAARMAVKEINQDSTILSDYTLEIIIKDTETDATAGAAAASELIDEGVVGLVGAASSGVSAAIQGVAKQKSIPQISYSSTSPTLSNKTEYPFFLRVVPPDSLQGIALAELVKGLNLDNVATLATSDDYGQGGIGVFEEAAAELGITIKTSQSFASEESNILTQLNAIKDSGAKVIILNTVVQDTITVFKQAEDAGLVGEDYIWIGSDGASQEQVFETAQETYNAIQGMVGTRPNVGAGTVYESFLDLWENCYGETDSVYPGCGDRNPNTYATFAYDAVWTYAHALNKMITDGKDYTNGTALLEYLYQTDFTGATGPISFDENGDRNGIYDIINLVGDEFKIIGLWSKTEGLKLDSQPDYKGLTTTAENTPGFGLFMAFLSILAVGTVITRRRR